MSLLKCGNGWRWGKKGKCYTNKLDAIKQGFYTEGPINFKNKIENIISLLDKEDRLYIINLLKDDLLQFDLVNLGIMLSMKRM